MKQRLVSLGVLIGLIFTLSLWLRGQMKKHAVSTFEECAAAGYPIMEIYPEQCRTPDGRNFVRRVEE